MNVSTMADKILGDGELVVVKVGWEVEEVDWSACALRVEIGGRGTTVIAPGREGHAQDPQNNNDKDVSYP